MVDIILCTHLSHAFVVTKLVSHAEMLPCNTNYSLVITCHKAVNNEHHPYLSLISLQNMCPQLPLSGQYYLEHFM